MKTIEITTSHPYHVVIGDNILDQIGSRVAQVCKAEKVAIISDTNVWPLYADTVLQSLRTEQFDTISYIFPAGENSKTLQTYMQIVNFLAENQLTRSDVIIALGGGTVGDIAGFVAATYLRGICFIQVPTSLLAMVDSSVGGKTAVDLLAGKNLVGAFYQPRFVLCDTELLHTLPARLFRDGCAEIIKYSILYDTSLFDHLRDCGLAFDREYVISRCVELKATAVVIDEFDTGERQKLNLGHTTGHALEALSGFALTHGQAVAIGIAIMARSASKCGYCATETMEKIISLLRKFDLPIHTDCTAADICAVACNDKKRRGNTVNLIIPKQVGQCIIDTVPINHLESFIEAGL